MKIDKDDVIIVSQHTDSPAARDSGASVIVLDDDSKEPEVRSKPGRTSAHSVSQEAVNSATDGTNSKREGEGQSLFYLTRVRGIGTHYNRSNVAIGIKGKLI